jgi:hypothetical protein
LRTTDFNNQQDTVFPKPEVMQRPKDRELFVNLGGSVKNPILHFPAYKANGYTPINECVLRWNNNAWETLAESPKLLVSLTRQGAF